MNDLSELIPIPPKGNMNHGLSSAQEATMLKIFRRPGDLTAKCSDPSVGLKKLLVFGIKAGPLKVSGMKYAVQSLFQIFDQVKSEQPEVYDQVKTAGMLCVRGRRANPGKYSNHSWGTAIDVYFGKSVVSQGVHQTQRGVYILYPYFNNHGWYWGAEFSGDSVDTMHFELAEETILKIGTMKPMAKSVQKKAVKRKVKAEESSGANRR
jgi:hypothetical protein